MYEMTSDYDIVASFGVIICIFAYIYVSTDQY